MIEQISCFAHCCTSFHPYFPEKMATIIKENSLNFFARLLIQSKLFLFHFAMLQSFCNYT